MIALQGHTPESLTEAAAACGVALTLPEARKVVAAVHRDGFDFSPLPGLSRAAREGLRGISHVPALVVRERQESAVDPFIKLAVESASGHVFETVRIPLEKPGRLTACVSSQVGCALACAFCATGRMGLKRNLETWEIVEQVRILRRTLAELPTREGEPRPRMHGVVFQGMGEPLANLDRVLAAIAVLTNPCALAIDARNITVCTSGLPDGIRKLAQAAPKVRLGLSLGSARAPVRRNIMPIEQHHPLTEVIDAVAAHATHTGLAPMWAVTLLEGHNDTADDATALAALTRGFAERTGIMPRLSIIAYNALGVADDPFLRSSSAREQAFRDILHENGLPTHRRYSGGSDVGAACGQLSTARSVA